MILERFEMRADPAWLARVDTWRKAQQPPLTRAAAVRKLAETGFKQVRAKPEQTGAKLPQFP